MNQMVVESVAYFLIGYAVMGLIAEVARGSFFRVFDLVIMLIAAIAILVWGV